MKHIQDLQSGVETAYIDQHINSNLVYRLEFISNDAHRGKRVFFAIEQELANRVKFCMANTTKTAVKVEE